MNPGICYLYEYKNDQKLRNVGFMKVTLHYRSCILQVNARGIPVRNGDSIKLLALYEHDSETVAKPIDVLPCEDKNIYARLIISEPELPAGKTLEDLGGFLLLSPNGQCYAAISDQLNFDTNYMKMWEENQPEVQAENEPTAIHDIQPNAVPMLIPDSQPDAAPAPNPDSQPDAAPAPVPDIQPDTVPAPIPEVWPDTSSAMKQQQLSDMEYNAPHEEPANQPPESAPNSNPDDNQQPQEKVRKIQRSEISILPRRCWNLANNSFLMHGYHNYNHLLLVEEDGHFWLGVPGIYAPREARAAELFGFPQFTQTYINQLELDDGERDDSEKFGYWCRFIR